MRSTQTAWLELDTLVASARNSGISAGLQHTDQSVAFNLIKADIIVAKLKVFGVQETALRLIRSYLTGRSTVCTVGHSTSSTVRLNNGMGEGSIVGTLFFIATLCDVTIVAKRVMETKSDHNFDIMVHLIAYTVSALIIGQTEAEI